MSENEVKNGSGSEIEDEDSYDFSEIEEPERVGGIESELNPYVNQEEQIESGKLNLKSQLKKIDSGP